MAKNQNKQVLSSTLIFNATQWCVKNGFKVYPHALDFDNEDIRIIVEKNGKHQSSKKMYTLDNVYQKIEELNVLIYEREQKKMQS